MGFRLAGQNKAVNYELITQQSAYQQQMAIYDALVDTLRRDPRLLADSKARDDLSRAQNLIQAEPTALFSTVLRDVSNYVAANAAAGTMKYTDLKSLLTKPNNVFKGQKDIISGWHGAEVHHMVPAASVAQQTSLLPYSQWGNVLYGTAKRVPFSSSAFNGVENRSEPGHNLSHLDVFGRQFYKGDSYDASGLLLPGSRDQDLVEQLVDTTSAARMISTLGGQADADVFLPELAERVSDKLKRQVNVKDFSDTRYSANGRGKSIAKEMKDATDAAMVEDTTEAAYGGTLSDGAEEYLQQRGIDAIKTADERRIERNELARKRRKGESSVYKHSVQVRPDIEQVLHEGGIDPNKLLGILLG